MPDGTPHKMHRRKTRETQMEKKIEYSISLLRRHQLAAAHKWCIWWAKWPSKQPPDKFIPCARCRSGTKVTDDIDISIFLASNEMTWIEDCELFSMEAKMAALRSFDNLICAVSAQPTHRHSVAFISTQNNCQLSSCHSNMIESTHWCIHQLWAVTIASEWYAHDKGRTTTVHAFFHANQFFFCLFWFRLCQHFSPFSVIKMLGVL